MQPVYLCNVAEQYCLIGMRQFLQCSFKGIGISIKKRHKFLTILLNTCFQSWSIRLFCALSKSCKVQLFKCSKPAQKDIRR